MIKGAEEASKKKIRVLVVDDSALMRKKISGIINSDAECEVIASAHSGEEALKVIPALRPDVVTLDIVMPKMDGITVLKYIMSEWPTPVIIVSGYSRYEGIEAIKCLEYGAMDLVAKPNGAISLDIEQVGEELLAKIKTAAEAGARIPHPRPARPGFVEKKKKRTAALSAKVVAIASSTGGPRALVEVLSKLPPNLPLSIIVIQHMPAGFTDSMAERLNEESFLLVKEAKDGESLKKGVVYIAPGGFHLTVACENKIPILKITKGLKENGVCPSADVTIKSITSLFGSNTMGVVLTGMGSDGVEGLREIKNCGGYTVAQDRNTSVVYGMPKAALESGVVDRILPLERIADEIVRWAGD